mmetsp:Transcript_50150/g.68214  ORF Transcript_50150/g.68214 Transcript_50150/m.68214 type:complete len:253 (-) Transcript_50150:13-771(-)
MLELARFDASDPTLPILMAVGGHVLDVSKSDYLYGPQKPRHCYAGRSITRALATGSVDEAELSRGDDLDGLTDANLAALKKRVCDGNQSNFEFFTFGGRVFCLLFRLCFNPSHGFIPLVFRSSSSSASFLKWVSLSMQISSSRRSYAPPSIHRPQGLSRTTANIQASCFSMLKHERYCNTATNGIAGSAHMGNLEKGNAVWLIDLKEKEVCRLFLGFQWSSTRISAASCDQVWCRIYNEAGSVVDINVVGPF